MPERKFKRSRWKPGNLYAVPLADGSFGIAQAIEEWFDLPGVLNVAVFDYHYANLAECASNVTRDRVIALAATWRAEMNGGWWALVGWAEPCVACADFPNVQHGTSLGQTLHSGGVIENLISAYHGLLPWNTNYREDYYDRLLAPGVVRPAGARLLNAVECATYRERDRDGQMPT